jgi:hypothetical protein
MKRTRTKKKNLRGISELAKGIYLIRVQEIHPRTGLMIDVRRRVHCETLEEAVAAQVTLRAENLGDGPSPSQIGFAWGTTPDRG